MDKYLIKDRKVVIATFNKGKVEEFKVLLSNYKLGILTPDKLGIGDVEETGKSFTDNSVLKVKNIPLRRYAYYLTPKGFAMKSKLTAEYLYSSFEYFRQTKKEFKKR